MNLPINDSLGRTLAVALLDPASGLWYDPTADKLAPLDITNKAMLKATAIVPVQVAAPAAGSTTPPLPANLFANLRNADVGSALGSRPNLVAVWFAIDSTGVPQSIADVWSNPFPSAQPIPAGGYGR